MVLFVNCCVRKESRTLRLAKDVLNRLGKPYKEVRVEDLGLKPLSEKDYEERMRLVSEGRFDDSRLALSKEFSEAETIVIAAPYWDMNFPSLLKLYLERVYVIGVVSSYNDEGIPHGLCKGKKLYYVTTSGGPFDSRYSYDYIHELATQAFGIRETRLVVASFLDVVGGDPDARLQEAIDALAI